MLSRTRFVMGRASLVAAGALIVLTVSQAQQSTGLEKDGSSPRSITSVPRTMAYQAVLNDSDGDPVRNTTLNVTFRIFDALNQLWTEVVQVTTDQRGNFTAILGETNPLNLSFDVDYYLELQIEGDPQPLVPRQKLHMAPYSARTDTCDFAFSSLGGGGWVDDGTTVRLETDTDNVGIGTNSPDYKLDVEGTVGIDIGSNFNDTPLTIEVPANQAGLISRIAKGGSVINVVDSDGNVGIGTPSPTEQLDVVGTAQMTGFKMPTGASNGYVLTSNTTGAGTWQAAGAGSNWSVSDSVLYTNSYWGLARGGADNVLYGDSAHTMINLGVSCTTGTSGQNVHYSTVSGGWGNAASGQISTVGGGFTNTASGDTSTVGGGRLNTASGERSTVSGGHRNTASGERSTVGGGGGNTASGERSTVGGGYYNTASGQYSTVGGGFTNIASNSLSTVGGGLYNTASGWYATVGGGENNAASGWYPTVGGGFTNTASGNWSTVSGGRRNSNAGDYSVIPGGQRDTLTSLADYSMAFGNQVYVNNSYRVAFFESSNSGRLGINRDDHDGGISHPIHVGTNNANGNGARLTAGGVWTNGSSRTFKENFHELGGNELLSRISGLPVGSWQFKDSDEKHIGPVAEDFVEAFDVGAIRESDGQRENQYLAASDVAGVALAGVRALLDKIEQLEARIAELEAK